MYVTYPLRNGRKEAIQHSRSHETIEARSSRTPRRSQERNNHKVPKNRQTTKIGCENNGRQSTGAKHENIPGLRMIDRVLTQAPYAVQQSSAWAPVSHAARPN